MWSWSGSATELDQSHSLNTIPEGYETGPFLPGVIIDAQKPSTIYFVRIYQDKSNDTDILSASCPPKLVFLMSVVRYDDGVPTNRWLQRILPASFRSTLTLVTLHTSRVTLVCPKMNAYGLYSIGIVKTGTFHDLAAVGFNIYKEVFIQRPFELMRDNEQLRRLKHTYFIAEGVTTWSAAHPMIPQYVAFAPPEGSGRPSLFCVFGDDEFHISVTNKEYRLWSFASQLPVGNKPDAGEESQTSQQLPVRPLARQVGKWQSRQKGG
ncbi:hypothetical protein E4U42_000191 [Claviceps africana]|uniref:Uncharacterized protein n=1 Tax=Claviceps africana TaxID=83212 RepID=A0A8K0J0U4_9HYPO|nr:hypothetical protein E4U42_000191 [Claviceps africana]